MAAMHAGPPTPEGQFAAALAALEQRSLRRQFQAARGRDFTTNDYLGLARDSRVGEAMASAAREWGAGSGAARLLGGTHVAHLALEAEAAAWLRSEAALYFPSGWHANVSLLATLAERGDVLVCDERLHASLIDGARLSRARVVRFPHDDPAGLARVLRNEGEARRRIVVVESVDSMDGTRAPLAAYDRVCIENDAWAIVDEAHAVGLYGKEGRGLATGERVLARMVTCGKALGVSGALVAAGGSTIDWLVNRARAFVYTTAPSPAVAAAVRAAIALMRAEPERAARVHENALALRRSLATHGVVVDGEGGPIVPVVVGEVERTLAIAARVQAAGFDVRAVRPPTVPVGTSRLRLVCHADHTATELESLANAVGEALRAEAPRSVIAEPARGEVLVVAGTDTGVGKTVVSALLCHALRQASRDVRYWKPVQTGSESDTTTVAALTGLPHAATPPPHVAFPLAASPDQAARDAGVVLRVADLEAAWAVQHASAPQASWVVELAGGLLVPLSDAEDQATWVQSLAAPIVLVARSGLGTLNHVRLTVEAMRARGLRLRAICLVGERHEANERTLAHWIDVPLVPIPHLAELTKDLLAEVAAQIELGAMAP